MRTFLIAVLLLGVLGQGTAAEPTRAVLVTGASTGIGRNVTEKLAAAGYFVYAGARKDADLAALNAIKNVQAIRLDVTRQEDVDAAVATITKAGRGLYGLVNNAGVASPGPHGQYHHAGVRSADAGQRLRPGAHVQGLPAAAAREQGAHHEYRFDLGCARVEGPEHLRDDQTRHRSLHRFAGRPNLRRWA